MHRVGAEDFADPGFAHFGSKYHLFRTGAGYGTRWTTTGGWSAIHKSMSAIPAWVDHAKPLLWAPEAFQSSDSHGALYVMYFAGQSSSRNVHCVGVATSPQLRRHLHARFEAGRLLAVGLPRIRVDRPAGVPREGRQAIPDLQERLPQRLRKARR
ncbi:hypothetical protein [Kribbella sp. NPDC004536]|uniref:hypothetical protein n=1 Tax=Kribbella sp. NPDC004536 TaxID=3364106 RepID=UPI0036A22060